MQELGLFFEIWGFYRCFKYIGKVIMFFFLNNLKFKVKWKLECFNYNWIITYYFIYNIFIMDTKFKWCFFGLNYFSFVCVFLYRFLYGSIFGRCQFVFWFTQFWLELGNRDVCLQYIFQVTWELLFQDGIFQGRVFQFRYFLSSCQVQFFFSFIIFGVISRVRDFWSFFRKQDLVESSSSSQ